MICVYLKLYFRNSSGIQKLTIKKYTWNSQLRNTYTCQTSTFIHTLNSEINKSFANLFSEPYWEIVLLMFNRTKSDAIFFGGGIGRYFLLGFSNYLFATSACCSIGYYYYYYFLICCFGIFKPKRIKCKM